MNRKRILVVDDEPGVTRSPKPNLGATARYEVRTENDSALAIDAVREFRPQLILLDVLMPHLDGCDVAARIHADPELKDTPIVFLTAPTHNEDTGGHAVVAGSTVYLAKPVDTAELIKCIEQTLLTTMQPRHYAFSFPRNHTRPPEFGELRLARRKGQHADTYYLASGGKEIPI